MNLGQIQTVLRYVIPQSIVSEWYENYKPWDKYRYLDLDGNFYVCEGAKELQKWCSENLSTSCSLDYVFGQWVISTTERDDLVLLTLKLGIPDARF